MSWLRQNRKKFNAGSNSESEDVIGYRHSFGAKSAFRFGRITLKNLNRLHNSQLSSGGQQFSAE